MIHKDTIDADIEQIVNENGTVQSAAIPILNAIQKRYHYLPEDALRRVCELTDITPASITGISTFYPQYCLTPVGRHLIHICSGTSCLVKGSESIYDSLSQELKIKASQDTDPEGLFTLRKVSCLGCCTLAPVVQIDDVTYGHVKTNGVSNILQDFISNRNNNVEHIASEIKYYEEAGEFRIGLSTCCAAGGA